MAAYPYRPPLTYRPAGVTYRGLPTGGGALLAIDARYRIFRRRRSFIIVRTPA